MMRVPTSLEGGKEPRDADLDELFAQAEGGLVHFSGVKDGRVIDQRGICVIPREGLAGVREALRIREGGPAFRCMCRGDLAIELFRGRKALPAIGLHHGASIRLEDWGSDAELADGRAFFAWLADHGAPGFLEAYEQSLALQKEAEAIRSKWLQAAPPEAREFIENIAPEALPPSQERSACEPVMRALEAAYPEALDRIARLFAWYGSGSGPWSGYPSYEHVADLLLAQHDFHDVISAVAAGLDRPEAETGAARFIAIHARTRAERSLVSRIPEATRATLTARANETGIADNIERLARALNPPARPAAPIGTELAGVSDFGHLTNLIAAGGAAFAFAGRRLLRFDPGSTIPVDIGSPSAAPGKIPVLLGAEGGELFYTAGDALMRMPAQGGSPTRVADLSGWPMSWHFAPPWVYWIEQERRPNERDLWSAVVRAPLSGGAPETVIEARPLLAWSLLAAGPDLYWMRRGDRKRFLLGPQPEIVLERVPLSGSERSMIAAVDINDEGLFRWGPLAQNHPYSASSSLLWWYAGAAGEAYCVPREIGAQRRSTRIPKSIRKAAAAPSGAYFLSQPGDAENIVTWIGDDGSMSELARFPAQMGPPPEIAPDATGVYIAFGDILLRIEKQYDT
jgi:hypothetical protein